MEGAIGAMCGVNDPLVSCLCVTENRPAFMPWLLWCFDRQTWANRELVIIDSSAQPFTVPSRDDIRVIPVHSGASVGRKRNLALAQSRGEIITWFDDDDWPHHPIPCRGYDCRKDESIWLDFEAAIINPDLDKLLEQRDDMTS